MADSDREVLFETRRHASRPYNSNYPPVQQPSEGAKGGLLSLLSVRGVSQLKEKWSEYRNPKRINKPISLFVSPRGERVAVAAGNRVTILRKEDDYQEPCGTFTSNNTLGSFAFGAWSEQHDVFGIGDDTDVHFIKANGVEITRVTRRQLKVSLPIIGLIAHDDTDGERSCLCSFTILTSDGCLHNVEICQEPSASISSTSAIGLTSKTQFPCNIFCFDYCAELSLAVLVGSTSSSSTSLGNSGSCVVSLWRRSENLVLESISSIQFEGLYCKAKSKEGLLAHPKVLISPKGYYVATLDVNGCLHVFKIDKESFSLSNVACGRRREFGWLEALVDFTWWSDHILTLAKQSGNVTMFDILDGLKLVKNEPTYSMPVVERVPKYQGLIFLLESLSSEKRVDPSNSHRGQIDEDGLNQLDFSRMHWTLLSFAERSVPEMYKILLSNCNFQAALDFADSHGLDKDEVLKSQWFHSSKGIYEINTLLSKIKDQSFVLSECVDKVGTTEETTKALLAYGLRLTSQYRFSESEDDEHGKIWDYRMSRLQLLQFDDRLETFLGINMGRFSLQEYGKFRIMPINEAAVTLAENGKIGALNLLFKRHPYSLAPFMLNILSSIPETVPVQTYEQLLPGLIPPTNIALREEDWVECDRMLRFISKLPENHELGSQIRTESIVKRILGAFWPSASELSCWYKNRATDIDSCTGLLDNCLCLVDVACRKGINELQQFHEDISYLHQLIYSDDNHGEICFSLNLVTWEQLSDYEKFRTMLKGCKEENVLHLLHSRAIPFMRKRSDSILSSQGRSADGFSPVDHGKDESFLVRWLKEIALENKLDICLIVIEEGCRELQKTGFFNSEIEAVDCALQCIYSITVTDRWNTMAAIISNLPHKQDSEIFIGDLDQQCRVAESHIEVGRLLSYYQVPKPINFFLEAHSDEKGVKQILRLILSKFVRRQPARSDSDWASMWRDMQSLREKAFPFLDPEFMLIEFCRGLLKAGKFSLARNYLKGTSSVALASEKAANLVIQAAREYFFSASSLACSEIWKAKECLNLFPGSRNVKAEADIIDALAIKLPNLGVNILPVEFRQIKDPMDIVKMAITGQAGAYLHVDELIEVAKLLGLSSPDDVSAVEEAIAREAAVAGDLQLAYDLCLVLAKKGHGLIWDLCAAIARGPPLENMDISSRKKLLGFALSHCDEESIGELLHAWKDLDLQGQCEALKVLSESNSPNSSVEGFSPTHSGYNNFDDLKICSELVGGVNGEDHEVHYKRIKNMLSLVAKNLPVENGSDWESLLENGKTLSFAATQLPWLFQITRKNEFGKKFTGGFIPGKQYVSVRTQAVITILSWLARNGFAPRDDLIASLAKSVIEPPVNEEGDVIGCSFLLNLVDAFSGVEVIEEQLRTRVNYQDTCSMMNVGMIYSLLHNSGLECECPAQRRELLLRKFKEKNTSLSSDEVNKIDQVQSSFWRQWKLKLEEKKNTADRSRVLEQIIPGVETARFLSGDINYIRNVVFSLIESMKLEKKHILKDVLKLADTYGLKREEVILRYLSSILLSEVWSNDDLMAEITEVKAEILSCASETIKTISFIVYPEVDGCNKQRLAYIYGLLCDCYTHLEESKGPIMSPDAPLRLARFFKAVEQECKRISFVKDLNFKNIAGLGGLNLKNFSNEVHAHINDSSLEALAKMVQNLVSLYTDGVPEGVVSWQDVYKHYVLSLLTTLESRARATLESRARAGLSTDNPENFQNLITQLEQRYELCRMHIKLLEPSDAFKIIKRYFTAIIPSDGAYRKVPDNSTWQDCLIFLLNFWIRLAEELQEFASSKSSVENMRFYAECLMSCLKTFMRLVMDDSVSPSQGWGTVVVYINHGLKGDFSVEIFIFCRAMVLSGCGFGAISEVFSQAVSHYPTSSAPISKLQDLPHFYSEVLEPVLQDLGSSSHDYQNLYHLVSSLSNMEGELEELKRVRHVVWESIAKFSENLQLPSQLRVYALELMQHISGKDYKSSPYELQLEVLPWDGWDESDCTGNKIGSSETNRSADQTDSSGRFTSTLVALKSTQLVAAISPSIEITPGDLLNVEAAVSCFLKLNEAATEDAHIDVLIAILEEWEGIFSTKIAVAPSLEASDAGNNWGNDDWDEGWESFQEVEPLEEEKKDNTVTSLSAHPLHSCWKEILQRLLAVSRFEDVFRLIDRSSAKSNGRLLDQDDARTLSLNALAKDCFMGLKIVLLLPYEALHLEFLNLLVDKLKQDGILDVNGRDLELITLIFSAGVLSTIISNPSYSTVFSYLCCVIGNLSRQFQETQLSRKNEHNKKEDSNFLYLFARILFPTFIAELVKADQQILAGFLVTKFMHTNASLSLINIAEASLGRYLERQLHALKNNASTAGEETSSREMLKNTVSSLRTKLENLLPSALSLVSR